MHHPFAQPAQERVFRSATEEPLAADHDDGLGPNAGHPKRQGLRETRQQAPGGGGGTSPHLPARSHANGTSKEPVEVCGFGDLRVEGMIVPVEEQHIGPTARERDRDPRGEARDIVRADENALAGESAG